MSAVVWFLHFLTRQNLSFRRESWNLRGTTKVAAPNVFRRVLDEVLVYEIQGYFH
ncbi:hypothetical protein [Desulfosporosinus sp.]|uniref:hypothetical protein n=1 Tax=Desulfosporosinus sp. TaxID=157907 RepID=UPI00263A3669|nr:hypothetical protein [Desulfosporosinus sp.]